MRRTLPGLDPTTLRPAATVVGLSLLTGPVLGLAWWLLAPRERLEVRAEGIARLRPAAENAVAADGWFAACGVTAGLLAGVLTALLVRRDRLAALFALTLGGVLGSLLAWGVGMLLGPGAVTDQAASLAEGDRLTGPLALSARGVLLLWPVSAVIAFFTLVAALDPPEVSPRGRREPSEPPTPPPGPPG